MMIYLGLPLLVLLGWFHKTYRIKDIAATFSIDHHCLR